VIQPRLCEVLVSFWRQIPRAAELIQQLIIERDKPQMFLEPVRVIRLLWHQLRFGAELEPAAMEQPRDHARS
jgi:hypothetical protein